jgi:glycosyltransferase involved in cell wall biosynthesis
MEKAVVSTSLGAEGLPVTTGENIELADAPVHFADAVVDLLEDDQRRRQLGVAGRQLVEARFSTESVARQFEAICQAAIENGRNAAFGRDGRHAGARRDDSPITRRSPAP